HDRRAALPFPRRAGFVRQKPRLPLGSPVSLPPPRSPYWPPTPSRARAAAAASRNSPRRRTLNASTDMVDSEVGLGDLPREAGVFNNKVNIQEQKFRLCAGTRPAYNHTCRSSACVGPLL